MQFIYLKWHFIIYIITLNIHFTATVWSGRGDHKKAYELLEKAKELHAGYLHRKEEPPRAYDEIFMNEVRTVLRRFWFTALYQQYISS